jgi:porphobilinogen deaminase
MANWYQTVKVVDARWKAIEMKRIMQTHPARGQGAVTVATRQHSNMVVEGEFVTVVKKGVTRAFLLWELPLG